MQLYFWFMHVLSPSFYLMYLYKLYCCITVLLLYDKCLAYLCWLCDKFHICKDLWKVNKYDIYDDIWYIWYDIHSFSNLSDDRSNASSKTVPPHSAIYDIYDMIWYIWYDIWYDMEFTDLCITTSETTPVINSHSQPLSETKLYPISCKWL